jgi:osmoprotectant transport system substrate-binding protein
MGEVHRARDTTRGRVVALKRLHQVLGTDDEFRKRFRRESELAARLSSPHVIPVHDWGEIDGRLFIDMRLAEGVDLAALLRTSGPLAPARAVALVRQVAAALDSAHDAGLVHRDVKPSNVLVADHRGHDFAYLVDFGIVRALDGSGGTSLTGTGLAIGTLAYMAPELFADGGASARSDVYALACVLHETLTGQVPFPVSSGPALMHHHLSEPPPRPSELAAGIPRGLDDVVARGMDKDPTRRYASPGDLAADAARMSAGVSSATPAPPPEPVPVPERGQETWVPRYPTSPGLPPHRAGPQGPPGPPPWTPSPPPRSPSPPPEDARSRRGWIIAAVAGVLAVVVALVVTLVVVTRSGGTSTAGGSGVTPTAAGVSLAGQTYTIGGKAFDEQLVLCKISILLLQSRGATVNDRCGIAGSAAARNALVSGQIDMYWNYTGTGWVTDLRESAPASQDPQQLYQAVRAGDAPNGLTWLAPTPFNNTYGIGTTRAFAAQNNLRTTSDFARFVNSGNAQATLCVEPEFASRDDGLPGFSRAYGLPASFASPPAVTTLDTGAIYQATANGSPCRFGEVFTTDGRLPGLDLVTLQDDRDYFPVYNASPVIRTTVLNRQPAVGALLEDVSRRMTDDVILGLNGQISSQGQDPAVVARTWLGQQGLI